MVFLYKKEKPFYKKVFLKRTSGNGFVYSLSGSGIYTDKNGHVFPFQKGDFLLVAHNCPYTIETAESEIDYITTAFTLDRDSSFTSFGLPIFFSIGNDQRIKFKVLSLLHIWETKSVYSKIEARLLLNEIFLDIRKMIGGDAIQSSNTAITPAIEYINKYYRSDIKIKMLADLCCMSESYFRSEFRKYIGLSPLKYRENLRIEQGKQLLKTELFSVKEIAIQLGYCDIYHFSKVFRKYCGISPSEYRKSQYV